MHPTGASVIVNPELRHVLQGCTLPSPPPPTPAFLQPVALENGGGDKRMDKAKVYWLFHKAHEGL